MALERFDPSSLQHRDDPYALYKKYREAEPIHWGLAPDPNAAGSWYFFEYEDVLAALKSDKFIHNRFDANAAPKDESTVSKDGSTGFQPASNCSYSASTGVRNSTEGSSPLTGFAPGAWLDFLESGIIEFEDIAYLLLDRSSASFLNPEN